MEHAKKILTVSVAAYNMENYLEECLSSLAIPEIAEELEVFVNDDGGTDRSLEIAKAYGRKFPGTFIPVHKENGGWGSTVNYSIAHATGKYFKILDGDDWFDRDGLAKLVAELKRTDADVVATDYAYARAGKFEPKKLQSMADGQVCQMTDVLETMPALIVHNLCYRTDILRASGLTCPEHMPHTDFYYDIVPFLRVKTVQYFALQLNYYRVGREGQSTSPTEIIRHYDDYVFILKNILAVCTKAEADGQRSYRYMIRCTSSEIYAWGINRIKKCHKCKVISGGGALRRIKALDKLVRESAPDVWNYSEKHCGKFIWLMRKTHYLSFWLNTVL